MINLIDTKTKIFYGPNSINALKKHPMTKVCIVTDKSIHSLGLTKPIIDILEDRKIEYRIFDKVLPDPRVDIVSEGVSHLLETKPDTIIAVGGGSVLDTAKAIIFLDLQLQSKVLRTGQEQKTFFIAIPTTSGTGSEVTSYSVVTDEDNNKIALTEPTMLPDIAILDPYFTSSLPKKVIAESGIDVFTHALEAYVSNKANPFSRAYAREALILTHKYLVRMYEDVKDEEARTNMHLASCVAGLAFENASLGLNHGMAHSLGSRFHLPHGLCNGILLPYVASFNIFKNEEGLNVANRYAEVADLFDLPGNTDLEKAKSLINYINNLKDDLNIPRYLKELEINSQEYFNAIPAMTEASMKDKTTPGNPVSTSRDEIAGLYKIIYG